MARGKGESEIFEKCNVLFILNNRFSRTPNSFVIINSNFNSQLFGVHTPFCLVLIRSLLPPPYPPIFNREYIVGSVRFGAISNFSRK